MAKEPSKPQAASAAPATAPGADAPAAAPAKQNTLKIALVLATVLLLEAGTVTLTIMLSGGPAKVQGQSLEASSEADLDAPSEVLVVREQFANQRTGKTMLYDTEIYIVVRKRDNDKMKKQIESMQAQLTTDIATIIRRSEPAYLLEPTLATLTRQIKAGMDDRLGTDAEGQPVVKEVLIRKWIGVPAS